MINIQIYDLLFNPVDNRCFMANIENYELSCNDWRQAVVLIKKSLSEGRHYNYSVDDEFVNRLIWESL